MPFKKTEIIAAVTELHENLPKLPKVAVAPRAAV